MNNIKNHCLKSILLIYLILITSLSYAYSPKIIAHRGGGQEFPENTILAFEQSLAAGSDGIELDVQLSKDEVVILYHPRNLPQGKVSDFTAKEIMNKNQNIPTLAEVLDKFPHTEIIVDLKSLPADKLIDAIIKLANEKKAWNRLVFYSTNDEHLDYFKKHQPKARVFENRTQTRERLLKLRNENICCCMNKKGQYVGFELAREMQVEESFALGKSNNTIHFKLWDKQAIECVQNSLNNPKIYLFGVNNKSAYEEAKRLNAYAIFTDKPAALIKEIN